jgi:hypothetical protein
MILRNVGYSPKYVITYQKTVHFIATDVTTSNLRKEIFLYVEKFVLMNEPPFYLNRFQKVLTTVCNIEN